jgi:hypothetical protein
METMKKEISFIDADNRRARVEATITTRNGYPEFTLSGQYMGGHGQVIDNIKPANEDQAELVRLWTKHHLKDVSSMHNFKEHLEGVLARIESAEAARDTKKLEGDEVILENMEQEGIDESQLDAVKAYISLYGDDLNDFEESYQGEYRDDEEFARELAESVGDIDREARWPYTCIDWEEAAAQLMQDYSEEGGYYFRSV